MINCKLCIAGLKAMDAFRVADEYDQRRFDRDGLVSYNPDKAARLWRVAFELSDAAPVNHSHSIWHASKHDDPAMMEFDPDSFYAIKEHVSDRGQDESILKHAPLDLWADHIEWCK